MPAETYTTKSINWGGVAKGVAYVTAAVAVAAVAYVAVPALINWAGTFITDPTTQTFLGNAWDAIKSGWGMATDLAKETWTTVADWWKALPADMGLKNTFSLPGADAVKSAVGPTAAIVAGAAAIPAAAQALNHTAMTTTTVHHDLGAHAAQHIAAEQGHGQRRYADRVQRRNFNGSFADSVIASKPAASSIQPSSGSYAKDITEQTASLDKALGK